MSVTNKFDFNKCYELYAKWDIERGRIMLYANINVFLFYSWFQIQDWYDDIVQDIMLEIDKRIQESIEKWYKSKQIYSYIKFKLRGYLLNRHNRKDSMMYFKSYWDDYIDQISCIWIDGWLDSDIIKAFIYEMKDPTRVILLLKHYSEFSLDKIAKHIWFNVTYTTKLYNEWIESLKNTFNPTTVNGILNTSKDKTHNKKG